MKRWMVVAMLAGLTMSACSKEKKDAMSERAEHARDRAVEHGADRLGDEIERRREAAAEEYTLAPAEVAARLSNGTIVAVDVNGSRTRTEFGVIEGAIQLTGAQDVLALPSDKSTALVFYCADESCSAAPTAAAAAKLAGYTQVYVMSAGIRGWAAAGQPTAEYTRTAADEHAPGVKIVSVNALEAGIAAGTHQAVDVNGASTRASQGVIPGAILLSGAETFAATELPADKALVFYCSSVSCTAAPKAAVRAQALGFTDVYVLSAGIRGWQAAGKTTDAQGD